MDKKNLLLENTGLLTPYQVLLVCLHHYHQPLPALFSNFTEAEEIDSFNNDSFLSVPVTGERTSSLPQFEVSPGRASAKTREP